LSAGAGSTGDEVAAPAVKVAAPAVAKAETPAWEDDAAEAAEAISVAAPVAKPSSQKAEDILAMIRSRKQ